MLGPRSGSLEPCERYLSNGPMHGSGEGLPPLALCYRQKRVPHSPNHQENLLGQSPSSFGRCSLAAAAPSRNALPTHCPRPQPRHKPLTTIAGRVIWIKDHGPGVFCRWNDPSVGSISGGRWAHRPVTVTGAINADHRHRSTRPVRDFSRGQAAK